MVIDGKYGRVTLEHGDIGEDEPVVVFRARDLDSRDRFLAWQDEHPDQVRVPTSENSRSWMD